METVTGAVQAAEKALLGDKSQSGEEPVSGVKGEGTASDPYDAGNASGMSRIFPLFPMFTLEFFPRGCSRFAAGDLI